MKVKLTKKSVAAIKAATKEPGVGRRRIEIGSHSQDEQTTYNLLKVLDGEWELEGVEDFRAGLELDCTSDGYAVLDLYLYYAKDTLDCPEGELDCNAYVLLDGEQNVLMCSTNDLMWREEVESCLAAHRWGRRDVCRPVVKVWP